MKSARYRFTRQRGRGFFADVTVSYYETTRGPKVEVADTIASHLRTRYAEAAIKGVQYALHHSEPPVELSTAGVTVTDIVEFVVDTCPGSVAAAACYATWNATERASTKEPRIENRQVVFDE